VEDKKRTGLGDASKISKYYKRVFSKNSGALINSNWAIEILANYSNYIQGCRTGVGNKYYIRGPMFYYVSYPAVGFVCYIVLPWYVHGEKRYFFTLPKLIDIITVHYKTPKRQPKDQQHTRQLHN
jgi:hypothetical protein